MAKLRRLSARGVVKILENRGFIAIRQRGSHIAMQRLDSDGATVTVIVPNHKQFELVRFSP